MSYLLTNLAGLAGLLALFCLTGRIVEQSLIRGRGMPPLSIEAWFGLGAAVWMGLMFILAAAQLLKAALLGSLVLLVLVIILWNGRATATGIVRRARQGASFGGDPAGLLLAAALGIILLALWVQAQWPRISWDADAYHLTVPRLYLEHEGFRRIPFNVYSNWPLNTQMLFAMALLAKDYVLAKLVHYTFGVATLLLVYRVVGTSSRPWAGWVAAILFLANPVVFDQFRMAYVDLSYAFFFFLAFLFVHQALEGGEARHRQLLLAGVFGGVAAGIKPTGLIAVFCLGVLYLLVSLRRGDKARSVLGGLGRLLIPAGLLLVPWLIKTWILTGNPVYPFLYPLFGGPEWSPELSSQLRHWQQGIGMGRGWLDYLLLPLRVIVSGGQGYDHFDGQILPVWLILVPLALLVRKQQPLISRSLGVAGVYFIFWALSSQQMRFLIPVLPLLAVAGALALVELSRRVSPTTEPVIRWGASLATLGLLVFIGSNLAAETWKMLRQYVQAGRGVRAVAVHPAYKYLNEELPDDAKLMFFNTNHGYFCQREFVADSFFEASQINSLLQERDGKSGIMQALAELQISHLLIDNRYPFVPWPPSLLELLNDPDSTRLIYRSPDEAYDLIEVLHGPRPEVP